MWFLVDPVSKTDTIPKFYICKGGGGSLLMVLCEISSESLE